MPKIKDLGINIIPAGMQPLEIGGGGGGGAGGGCGCTNITNPCIGCTGGFNTVPGGGCGCTNVTNPCLGFTKPWDFLTKLNWCRWQTCGQTWRGCFRSETIEITPHTPVINPGTLRAEDVAAVRQQLKERLDALDAYEKSLGAEHFDAREQQLQKELEQLKARKSGLKK